MAINLSRFRIEKLHGYKTVEIEITNNKLIIVGENGTGKTTVINTIYYFLSGQWQRLKEIDFQSLTATVNQKDFYIDKEDLLKLRNLDLRFVRRIRTYLTDAQLQFFLKDIDNIQLQNLSIIDGLEVLHNKYRIPRMYLRDALLSFQGKEQQKLFEETDIENLRLDLRKIVTEQVLYLPTYRRIEQELEAIFPQSDMEDVIKKIKRQKNFSGRHIELIEFGMQDVEFRINEKMKELKDTVIGELNNLTGAYLGEILGGKYKSVSVKDMTSLEAETVKSMLSRIDNKILPEKEKEDLQRILSEIKTTQKIEEFEQLVIAHFLLKLFEVHKIQTEKENNVNLFVKICNKYLVNKELVYDNSEFKINITLTDNATESKETGCVYIGLKHLSSGEKQIVSLFSHLFLSPMENFFVMIDEPELSLSVPWQKEFLPDILNSGYCSGLIAVTHSPFIFENELDSSAHSIDEFFR